VRPKKFLLVFLGIVLGLSIAVYVRGKFMMSETPTVDEPAPVREPAPVQEPAPVPAGMAIATFGNGCFWCTEAVFQRLKGVQTVVSGYSGGRVKNPTYGQVCTGTTGHAEAIQIIYDPARVSYQDLLEVFWKTHDPTTRDRQGDDVGPQYRSVVFYHSDEQRELAEHYKKKLDESGLFGAPIVTEITPFTVFYRAEDYHQNYFNEHSGARYCRFVIGPKVEKLQKVFHDKLKTDAQ
jgi:peptide-methionine (S)-S-oxide reductase